MTYITRILAKYFLYSLQINYLHCKLSASRSIFSCYATYFEQFPIINYALDLLPSFVQDQSKANEEGQNIYNRIVVQFLSLHFEFDKHDAPMHADDDLNLTVVAMIPKQTLNNQVDHRNYM